MQQSDGCSSSLYTYGVGTIQIFARSSPCSNKQGRHEENNKHSTLNGKFICDIMWQRFKYNYTTTYKISIEK